MELPDSVEVGANVVLHAGTTIGPGARLLDACVVGKPVALGPHSARHGKLRRRPRSARARSWAPAR